MSFSSVDPLTTIFLVTHNMYNLAYIFLFCLLTFLIFPILCSMMMFSIVPCWLPSIFDGSALFILVVCSYLFLFSLLAWPTNLLIAKTLFRTVPTGVRSVFVDEQFSQVSFVLCLFCPLLFVRSLNFDCCVCFRPKRAWYPCSAATLPIYAGEGSRRLRCQG